MVSLLSSLLLLEANEILLNNVYQASVEKRLDVLGERLDCLELSVVFSSFPSL